MADVVGAQLPDEAPSDWKPQLSGFGPDKIVAVLNPLKADFRVLYARSAAINPTLSPGAQLTRERIGLDLSARSPKNSTTHSIILKSGKTMNLPGDVAQKAVQDLVTYILGVRTGHKKTADPVARGEVEAEVILSIKDSSEFFNTPVVENTLETEIEALNTNKETPNPPPGQGTSYVPGPAKTA